jgi:hypothetical protein
MWFENAGKRLRESPRTDLRDSGTVQALLDVGSLDALLGHPVCGGSREGFVLENPVGAAGTALQPHGYRTSAGAEIDLLLVAHRTCIAIEINRATAPAVSKGLDIACDDIGATARWVVYPGKEAYPGPHGIEVLPVAEAMRRLRSA